MQEKKENQEGDKKNEVNTEGHYGSSGNLVVIVTGWV
jgi:hypothetical protein